MGGAEMSLLDLLGSLRAAEPDWDLWLILGEEGPLAKRARELDVQVVVEPFPPALAHLGDAGNGLIRTLGRVLKASAGTVSYVSRLRRKLSGIKPDLIHTNGFKMHLLGLWAGAGHEPVIWHIRDYVSSRPLMRRMLGSHASRCAAAVAISESVARDLEQVCGPRLATHCIYNAVDLKRYSPEGRKSDLDGLSNMPPAEAGIVRIGLVATLARWKGHDVFLRALAHLPAETRYRAYVIGGPIYQTENSQHALEELRTLAFHLKIGHKVGFTGFVEEPADAMRALDIVVHASTQPEPFGRVIAEAMACGRAVLCSAGGGAAELVTEGQDALCHQPGNVTQLAQRISELALDPGLRDRLSRAARSTAETRFDCNRLAAELIPVYQRALRGNQPAPAAQLPAFR
jgi:glycosyltransferase involved in cell wall biosynthesis